MNGLLSGKTILITGASSGFGESMAETFAREGASLILLARRQERLIKLEAELRAKYGVEVVSLAVDVMDREGVKQALLQLPPSLAVPDVLINNAGMVRGVNKVWETPPEDWDEMIDINIKGVLNLCSLVIPGMVARKAGHIVNIGSVSGHDTYPGGGVYCATKYAVTAITETLRKELVSSPIRVSLVSPGMARTEFSLVRFAGDKGKAEGVYDQLEPLVSEDIAEIVLFILTRPSHVNIADVIVYPTHQASVSLVHRGGEK